MGLNLSNCPPVYLRLRIFLIYPASHTSLSLFLSSREVFGMGLCDIRLTQESFIFTGKEDCTAFGGREGPLTGL